MNKHELRKNVRERVATLSKEQRRTASHHIFEQVAALPDFVEAQVVAIYAALPDEPYSHDFINKWHGHKRIVLPRVEGAVMRFYDYSPEGMHCGSFGITEPQGLEPCPPEDIDLMIVPGVAFTPDGKRMGRGKGFYDKYISQASFRAHTIGVCFKEQILDEIPTSPHDKNVKNVIAH